MSEQRESAGLNLQQLTEKPLEATGQDIPPGSYPGILLGYGEPFMLDVIPQYRKAGQPTKRAVFEATFLVRLKDGTVGTVDQLVSVPAEGVNRRSNLFRMLVNLAKNGIGAEGKTKGKVIETAPLIDDDKKFAKGTTLGSFVGRPCAVTVKLNTKGWPTVDTVTPPMDGLNYPTLEEAKTLSSEDVPF